MIVGPYPMVQPPAWVAEYIGIPYKLGGRTRVECDCWGICMMVLEDRFVAHPPRFPGVEWDTHSKSRDRAKVGAFFNHATETLFDPVEPGKETEGDVVVLRISGQPLHVGIVVALGWMLHSAEDADSAIERYDGMLWCHRVTGFYRLKAGANEVGGIDQGADRG